MSIIPTFLSGQRSDGVFDPFSLDAWDSFEGWPFSSSLRQPSDNFRSFIPSSSHAMVDWRETPDAHVFKVDVPGLRKEEVKVVLVYEYRLLQISGERKREMEEMEGMWHMVQRSSGPFLRRFRLPENVKMETAKASMKHGVLTVTVPKIDQAKKPDIENIVISEN